MATTVAAWSTPDREGTRMRIRIASLAIVTAALVAAGCSSDAEPSAESESESPRAGGTEAPPPSFDGPTISIEGFAFSALDPVAPGTEIGVVNLDGAEHTLTADDGLFNTGGVGAGTAASFTAPDAPGTYTFICNIHPTMTGSFTVEG